MGTEHHDTITYLNEKACAFICPLCDESESRQEVMNQFNEMRDKGYDKLKKHFIYYREWISSLDDIDIFENLEINYNKIQEIKNNYDENKYFRYRCPKKNEEIYIIFYEVPKAAIEELNFNLTDQRYEYTRWKNDPNLKKVLLEERKKNYDANQLRKKKQKIENEIADKKKELLDEWNDRNWQKEYTFYQQMCQEAKSRFLSRRNDSFYAQSEAPLCMQIYGELNVRNFKFIGGKLKFAEFCANLARESSDRGWALSSIKKYIIMSDEEKKMFDDFSGPTLKALRLKLEQELK